MTNELGNDELDDLIAEVMQAEIPPPANGYWTRIDRSLARPTGLDASPRSPRSPTGWTATRLLVSAAAIIVVIAVAGAVVFATLSDSSTDLKATGEPQPGTPTSLKPTFIEPTPNEPAPSEPAPSEPADIVVSSFEAGAVTEAGIEAIGCWFYRSGNQSDLVFYGGFQATVMVIDGRQIIGHTTGFWSVEDTVTTAEYEIRFTDIGVPVADSIESQRQPATLVVTPTDPTQASITIPGDLWCGV